MDRSGWGEDCSLMDLSGWGEGAWEMVAAEMLLDDEMLGASAGAATSGSWVTEIEGEDTSRAEAGTIGEGASRGDNMAGEAASRAKTVRALRDEEGREMGEAADDLFVTTGFLRRPWKRTASPRKLPTTSSQ